MSKLDRWPSTPVKLITAWAFSVVFFLFALILIWTNRTINEMVFITIAGTVLGADVVAAAQMYGKRKTAWQPPSTPSEAGSGQVVDAAVAKQVQERVEASVPDNPAVISAPTPTRYVRED